MDAEQQVRLNFLEEASECCDRLEASLLGISTSVAEPAKLDQALRASHSIKGGASLMGYGELSHCAHRLEDFLKILRVRYANTLLDTRLETLFLQSVDRLRELSGLCRSSQTIDPNWINQFVSPIYTELRESLGDLQEADEEALLHQNEDVDPALQMFEEGVDRLVDEFEEQLRQNSDPETVAQALLETIESLLPFGYMAELDAFIELCQFVQTQAAKTSASNIRDLSEAALSAWRRSHGLVVRRSLEKLPHQLEAWPSFEPEASPSAQEELQASNLEAELNPLPLFGELDDNDAFENLDLIGLQAEFSEVNRAFTDATPIEKTDTPLTELEELEQLAQNQDASEFDLGTDPFEPSWLSEDALEALQSEFEQLKPQQTQDVATSNEQSIGGQQEFEILSTQATGVSNKSIRISADQLSQFNTLFSKLVLERNLIQAQMEQLKADSTLMRRRISQLSQSNSQLRKWYDRASMEGVISNPVSLSQENTSNNLPSTRAFQTGFDALEMDQYSDLHVISQDQIETLVQLQEVTVDLDTGIRAIDRSIKDLTQTTQLMQKNVTQVQMMPFDDLVKRFPRVIRDLNQQFNKSVQLSIEGQSTLIDRAVTDALGDALIHLLRNAFDHGIEPSQKRIESGKPAQGNIILRAENRNNQTVITLSDDGVGIQFDKIRDRLVQLGVDRGEVTPLKESELIQFIFDPGFSTATQVTEVSGRGVGMDLVQTNLSEIRGEISVMSQPGQGTTFILKVPYNLSIMKVALVEKAGVVLALPVDSIREVTQQLQNADLTQYVWNNQTLPCISLDQYLSYSRPGQRFEMSGNPIINHDSVIVAGDLQRLGAFTIDRFWGEQEVTIQPVSNAIPLPPGFVGSLIMGDGRVIPLVDPAQLLEWCQEQPQPVPRVIQPEVQATQLDESTILVVDDSINVRKLLTINLEKAGFRVEQAKDGQDALDRLLTGLKVNAVICDIEMPRLDGYGFLEEIKAKKQFKDLPILMLTSRSNDKHRKLAFNLGASDYIAKPYNEAQLISRLQELVQVDSPQSILHNS